MIVFCTTCKNRTAHLRLTLPQNLADNPKSKFVVLNYNTDDDLVSYIENLSTKEGRLVLYNYYDAPQFRMSHAKNMAHRLGILEGGDILVNLDADNLAGAGFEDFIEREFAATPGIFLFGHMLKGKLVRGISGRVVVSSQAFLKAGGYDETKFNGWGSDDKDLNLRLRLLGYDGIAIPPSYLGGVAHNDKIRFKEYPHLANESDGYFEVSHATVSKTVVNDGQIGCGMVFRNQDHKPLDLAPIPTRVFGIGSHKTGTVSLHKAFKILGFDSWHWSSAHAAKAIWREMNTDGRSPTLEWYYALCDLPIPMLYRQLDEAYPNSKFILTVRNEQEWLESVRKHFDPIHNKWRASWDTDPFTNRVHQILYGRTDFDEATMLARYRRHNEEVQEYFRSRPNDLFIMLMNGKRDWGELPQFLNQPTPDEPFPHENRSKVEE